MSLISIVYWSQSGNTQEMARAIETGVKEAGKEGSLVEVGNASLEDLKAENIFALGCPAMGAEELEDAEMELFVAEVEKFAAGKKIALFGSFGWGDGQWMRDWVDRMKNAGAEIIGGEGLMCNEAPDDQALASCKESGKKMASL